MSQRLLSLIKKRLIGKTGHFEVIFRRREGKHPVLELRLSRSALRNDEQCERLPEFPRKGYEISQKKVFFFANVSAGLGVVDDLLNESFGFEKSERFRSFFLSHDLLFLRRLVSEHFKLNGFEFFDDLLHVQIRPAFFQFHDLLNLTRKPRPRP